ncbi:MAG: AraC family transcriptional regulator, partial [Bacteroidota bacterium]
LGREIDQKYNFQFQGGQHNLIYANGLRGEVYYPVNAPVQTFEVNMTTDFIRRYLPPDDPVFRDFRKALGGSRFAYLSQQHLPITAPMLTIIQDILANNQPDIFRRHYLEAKVIELLMLQLEQYRDQPAGVKLSSQERDRMHAVGQHLNKHMEDVYTLTTLAQTFGTNEYALKRNFKKVFGTTVFTYWTQAKMETARGLLLAEGLPVKEVAYRVGYKNPQHFSSAFKRYFGYSPSQLFCG